MEKTINTLKNTIASVEKKFGIGPFMLAFGILLSVTAGLSVSETGNLLIDVVRNPASRNAITAIILVNILGYLLKEYQLLDKIIAALKEVISSSKAIMMVFPLIIGILSVPGSAYLSAPFVDQIGEELHIDKGKRVAVNLSFRHVSMFLLPFTSNMVLIVSIIPQINIYHLAVLNLVLVAIMQVLAAFLYMRGAKKEQPVVSNNRKAAAKDLLIYLSPLYIIVVLNALFGVPIYLSLIGSVFLVFLLSNKKAFLINMLKGISIKICFMLLGIFFVQNVVKNMDGLIEFFTNMYYNSSDAAILLVIMAGAILFGTFSGLPLVPVGIILPIIVSVPMDYNMLLIYTFFLCMWSFIGYYFSPIHLCQILTIKCVGCTTTEVYKEHIKIIPWLCVLPFVLFYIYKWILIG